jgi:hypothetical protein
MPQHTFPHFKHPAPPYFSAEKHERRSPAPLRLNLGLHVPDLLFSAYLCVIVSLIFDVCELGQHHVPVSSLNPHLQGNWEREACRGKIARTAP